MLYYFNSLLIAINCVWRINVGLRDIFIWFPFLLLEGWLIEWTEMNAFKYSVKHVTFYGTSLTSKDGRLVSAECHGRLQPKSSVITYLYFYPCTIAVIISGGEVLKVSYSFSYLISCVCITLYEGFMLDSDIHKFDFYSYCFMADWYNE